MDIGIWMAPEVLAHKLQARAHRNPEEAWNLTRWPSALSEPGPHRLFVASDGAWRGYFVLAAEALYNPSDPKAPFTLLFDTRTWRAISPLPVLRFRGFTRDVPSATTSVSPPVPVTE
ncbi:MAG: hypothetical protein DIJKHBIC_04364 [Thermoanaerobaculia bacterium]|nr:hypothetical protein [Thermoanaerobaculia bacterium]